MSLRGGSKSDFVCLLQFDYKSVKGSEVKPGDTAEDSRLIMDRLTKYIFAKDSTDRIR